MQDHLKQGIAEGSSAGCAQRRYTFTQYHRQFLCYLKLENWTPVSRLPDMHRTALALLRDELIEIPAGNDVKLYRMTQKGADRLAAPRR